MPEAESSFFSSLAGLPLHPLVVHFAVVLLPLSALALVALVVVPRWAHRFGVLTVVGLAAGTAAAFVAKESGESLAATVGEPATHATWGDLLPLLSAGLLVLATAWLVLQRRTAPGTRGSGPTRAVGALAAALAVGVTALTVVVGHSGAQAVWEGSRASQEAGSTSTVRTAPASPSPAPTGASSSPGTPVEPATPSAAGYTMGEVAKHADANSCWTVVEGNVYDLTDWVERHPGGARRILDMCGRDATTDFTAEHGGQGRPERELATFLLGPVSG